MATSNTQKKRATADDSSLSASKGRKSSPASSSGGHSQWTYEVFLSFRGEDTRNNFTDHLYAALNRKGIYTFRDDERLERGTEISSELLEAIEISKVSIIILSKNYASSTWCLNELAKIVECMEAKDQTVLPVFYKVDPSDVRKQSGDFKTAFDKHEQDFWDNLEQVKRWRSALKKVGGLAGWPLHDSSEAELITDIVNKVWKRLNQIQHLPSFDEGLVGIDSRAEEIYELVGPDILDEIRFVGICGMGGIGKTTIARVVYERLSDNYDGSCFLANVRESSEKRGLESLQEMLLREVLNEKDFNIRDCYKGICLIEKWLCRKKILLVLDDVDQLEQLKMLAKNKAWFGSGSRIIITTRDERVLISHGINKIYWVKGLDHDEAHRLLCLKAFKCLGPTNDHVELLERVVSYADGLPLALEILGSFLCDRNVKQWESELKRLEAVPNLEITKKLRISYDGLERIEKQIFLDIACFFKGEDVDKIKKILDSCNFQPDIGISVLVEQSLINIKNNKLQMHDLVQAMGWEVVREQDPNEPGKWSRLWLCQDIHCVLAGNMGTPAVEAMMTVNHNKGITHANGKCFLTMSKLRLLDIGDVHISEDLEYLSNELRILKWRGYYLKTLPSSFNPQKLFQLSLCRSRIKYLWNGIKAFDELTTIELTNSENLVTTPDFTMIPKLERLDLEGCRRLREVHESVGLLERLVVLNLKNCENLVQFPSNVCGLKSLKILNFQGCLKLGRLPHNLGEMEHLEELDVSGTAIRQVPPSIGQLRNLRTLSFCGCKGGRLETWSNYLFSWLLPTRKPDCMGLLLPPLAGLSCLEALDISYCNLGEGAILRDVGSLYSLRELNISGNNFVSLPDAISQLSKLQVFRVEECRRLQSLPKLAPALRFLVADGCTSLEIIPSVLELTSSEIILRFSNCSNLETRGRNNNNLAIMLLKRWLQRADVSNHDLISPKLPYPLEDYDFQCHICLPGSEIPNLFSCQSEGSQIYERLLPNGWLNDEFMGFAVCAVFSPPDHSDKVSICCDICTTSYCFDVPFSYPVFSTTNSIQLFLAYLSPGEDDYVCSLNDVFARFFVNGQTEPLVKRCGIHPLYKQDVENLENFENLSATDVGIAMVRHLLSSSRQHFVFQRGVVSNHDPISSELPYSQKLPCSQFHICLPGSEIPNLFSCQSEGSQIYGRLLPDGWLNDEFMGFAVCVVFSLPDHWDIVSICCDICTTSYWFADVFSLSITTKSDQLLLAYISRGEDDYACALNGVFARFRLWIHYRTEHLVKRCGIRPLYKQDVENLENLPATDVGTSMVQHFLSFSIQHFLFQRGDVSNHRLISSDLRLPDSQFHICLPGSEIPNLFNCQSEGSRIYGRLPDGWLNDEFMGFAVCAVFSPPDHSDDVNISCDIRTTYYCFDVGFSYSGFSTAKSDHLWLAYLPRGKYYYVCALNGVVARFLINGRPAPLVKRCGIRPLYKQDVEYLEDLSATDVGISMVQHFPRIWDLMASRIRMPKILDRRIIRGYLQARR